MPVRKPASGVKAPDFRELMAVLSRPRPNGSAAEGETVLSLGRWLRQRGIPYRLHTFRHYPFFFEAIGLWTIASRTLLALAVWLRWGWPALPVALLGLVIGVVDVAFNFPTVSRVGARRGRNLIVEFAPEGGEAAARQELILSAHYDSKTELLDHRQRMIFLYGLPVGLLLTLLLGLLAPLDRYLLEQASPWAIYTYWAGLILSLPMLFLAWGLGLNLALGRSLQPSQGAVDNGAACAILLGLAERLSQVQVGAGGRRPVAGLQQTKVTIALFTGEEVNLQGSRAYAQERDWPLPAIALNLEAMAQDGEYVLWERDGSVFKLESTSAEVNRLAAYAVEAVTGRPPRPGGPVISDAASFLKLGIPATTLGTYHSRLVDAGFHRPSDNLARVMLERLPEGVEILATLLREYDRIGLNAG